MNKLTLIILLVTSILMTVAVDAAVDVTYTFDQPNVRVLAVDCLDTSCSKVQPFSGNIIKGPTTTDGALTLRYADSLATQYGYAEFFVSPGFRPLVGKHNWNTKGLLGIATTTQSAVFTKMPNTCRATISDVSLTNDAQPNKPLTIQATGLLDATTTSAFQTTDSGVDYIPPELAQEYWGADTIVKLEILNGSTVMNTQQQDFTAAKNNAILAEDSAQALFTYTPTALGMFTARVTSHVIDNQCAAQEDQNSQKTFAVANPQSQFYSLLNNLKVDNLHPEIGDTVTIWVDKITNHASNNGTTLTQVPTSIDFVVTTGTTTILNITGKNVAANPDAINPVTQTFEFTPSSAGVYTITTRARANSNLSTTQPEITAEQSMQITVKNRGSTITRFTARFHVTNAANNAGIANAIINLIVDTDIHSVPTDANGDAVFINIPAGTYKYRVTATNFTNFEDSLNVTNDITKNVALTPSNQQTSTTQITSIRPLPGVINKSSLLINTTTNNPSTCQWILTNALVEKKTGNFTTSNGLQHTATITGLTFGNNSVTVICTDQSTSVTQDLIYTVQNILDGSTINGINNTITQSSIINSTVTNSTITNSTITNSNINNAIVTNALINGNIITNGTITINNVTYNATQGSINIGQLVEVAPVASFIQTASIIEPQKAVIFTSTSTDANIGNPLNDSIQLLWNFGDGSTSTQNSVSKSYDHDGVYTITLKATDRFNMTNTSTNTLIVLSTYLASRSSSKKHVYDTPEIVSATLTKTTPQPTTETTPPSQETKQKSIVEVTLPQPKNTPAQPEEQLRYVEGLLFFNVIMFGLSTYVVYLLIAEVL